VKSIFSCRVHKPLPVNYRTAAMEGRGLMLLVEKDLHHRGYRKDEPGTLHLQPPTKPYTIIPDAVDNLIEVVRAKNGKVIFHRK
jgi:hypothetical protein